MRNAKCEINDGFHPYPLYMNPLKISFCGAIYNRSEATLNCELRIEHCELKIFVLYILIHII